ncbi:DEKNAAC102294 [Brettanomyces naardenensis]|uniref:DEKNAAC102294 n=1 Tax=Brettanomyces naardenensis TaxID=13370 RepID=A0A448YL50_BRENA|nr:DEKNAAC102294 [Brettanomyces naardenensis]
MSDSLFAVSCADEPMDDLDQVSEIEPQPVYDYERYLPPYRSLINPDQGYDYRSHQYFDTERKNEFSFLTKYRSLLITPLNNTKQMILDAASDSFSIKSFRSRKSLNQSKLSVLDLPDEIILKIFSFLRSDLVSLVCVLYVNRRFNDVAKPVLYEDPYITTTFRLSQFVQTININKQLALMVKKLDLSRIQIGVELKEDELDQFATNIVFGSCGGQYDDLLMANGDRRILAGWRDFKYRFNPLYSGVGHRPPSSTSFVPPHEIPDQFTRNHIYSPSASKNGRTSQRSLWSLTTLSPQSSFAASSSDSINSLFSIYNDPSQENQFGPRRRNSTPSTSSENTDWDSDSENDEPARRGSYPAVTGTDNSAYYRSGREVLIQQPGFFNSLRLFLWSKVLHVSGTHSRKGNEMVVYRRRQYRGRQQGPHFSGTRRSLCLKRRLCLGPCTDISRPFSTTHPQQSQFLKQYCFARDIPIGYILHILEECENLQSIDLSGIAWSVDFQLEDYEYFDWEISRGKVKGMRGTVPSTFEYRSMLLTDNSESDRRREELSHYQVNKSIYWSDTVREIDFQDPELRSLTIASIWPYMMKLKHLEVLKLCNSVWLDKRTLRSLVMKSQSRRNLKIVDCTNSGLARNSSWATCRTAKEWRQFFRQPEPDSTEI